MSWSRYELKLVKVLVVGRKIPYPPIALSENVKVRECAGGMAIMGVICDTTSCGMPFYDHDM